MKRTNRHPWNPSALALPRPDVDAETAVAAFTQDVAAVAEGRYQAAAVHGRELRWLGFSCHWTPPMAGGTRWHLAFMRLVR
jgi:hypothetical protein